MVENNYFSENQDLLEQFDHLVDWPEIVEAYENGFSDHKKYQETGDDRFAYAPATVDDAVQYYRTILDSVGDLTGHQVAPVAADMEAIGLKYDNGKVTFPQPMVEAYNKVREAGVQPYAISRKFGGLGLPSTVQCIEMELLGRADGAFGIAIGCVNLAETIERFADEDMVQTWVPQMAEGNVCGAMALTEPNYGSDLPNIRTRAEKDENGVWRINGTKRFITHGCGFAETPSVILTLARTGSPTSGAKGLSFFLVQGKDVHIAGIEKKLGLHCSPTCEVVYENTPAQLIGKEGFGLVKYAMGMMNAARLSIAAQSMGIATAAYYEARKYASEREQFGKLIQEIPGVRKMLDRMDREIAAMRCLMMEAARTIDLYHWKQHRLEHEGVPDREIRKDEQIRFWNKMADYFTPLAKYYISELCNSIAYDALQIHGGAGYTEEYDVARIYRDARITNIYEGTTQMQMHAAIGGINAGMSQSGHLREYLEKEFGRFTPSAELKEIRELFETITERYREIKNSEMREIRAFEAVESSARLVNGMLMERGAAKLNGAARDNRLRLAMDYHLDSLAIMQGNLIRIEAALKDRQPAAV